MFKESCDHVRADILDCQTEEWPLGDSAEKCLRSPAITCAIVMISTIMSTIITTSIIINTTLILAISIIVVIVNFLLDIITASSSSKHL